MTSFTKFQRSRKAPVIEVRIHADKIYFNPGAAKQLGILATTNVVAWYDHKEGIIMLQRCGPTDPDARRLSVGYSKAAMISLPIISTPLKKWFANTDAPIIATLTETKNTGELDEEYHITLPAPASGRTGILPVADGLDSQPELHQCERNSSKEKPRP